jgi:hypothetical protein
MPRAYAERKTPAPATWLEPARRRTVSGHLLLLNRRKQSCHSDPSRGFARRIEGATHITGIESIRAVGRTESIRLHGGTGTKGQFW